MSGLLASVCSVSEAELALQTCVDIIDCKDPHRGALGALAPELITGIVLRVGGRRPVSATTGDLCGRPRRLRRAIQITADCGVDYIKFGLFEADRASACLAEIADLGARQDLIAVCFADRFDPAPLLPLLADSGCHGVMIDTADKRGGSLTELWATARIAGFVAGAQRLGLLCGLAGRLRLTDIARLRGLGADYLGFRGAVCGGDRRAGLDHRALMQVRDALPLDRARVPIRPRPAALH